MLRRRLIWRLYPLFLAVLLPALLAAMLYFSHTFRRFYYDQMRGDLQTLAAVVAPQIVRTLGEAEPNEVDALCKSLSRRADGQVRFTVVTPTGIVLGDSEEDPALMGDHSDREEIGEALRVGFGQSVRLSPTLGQNMMYVALPVLRDGQPVAVVRTALPVTAIDRTLNGIYIRVAWAGLVIALIAAALSLLVSRRISRPIVQMQRIAKLFARGQLNVRVPASGEAELDDLANALNEMAAQLRDRIGTITEQRNELGTILSSMLEGVVAVDTQGRIVNINKAAAQLLDTDSAQAQGRIVEEIIRNVDLQQFIRDLLRGEGPAEGDVSFPADGRFFHVRGAGLSDPRGECSGAVIVLSDMTRVRRLEDVRRDFVANVSHELKTPVTSIQGFVEALQEGGLGDPEQARRYVDIIARHAQRLDAIINDLLSLSRLEDGTEKRAISFETARLKPVLETAVDLSGIRVDEKQIHVDLACDEGVEARVNVPLLEQAVLNLVDNAIKYSEPNGTIEVRADQTPNETTISVVDHGCGIPSQHLRRIFERFYVVDKGRSRKLGGTGLGLSIVKHIAQVHRGYVTVQSEPGKGSTFTFHLPRTDANGPRPSCPPRSP